MLLLCGYHEASSESAVCYCLKSGRFSFNDNLANCLKEIEKSLS